MNVALIHDHLAQDGGAEKVLRVFAELYPQAPIYTLLYEQKHVDAYFRGRHIETSVIQKLPGGVKHYQWYMPFMPMAVEFFDLTHFDVVISDASAFAKGVITAPDTLHICYCHTPTRYLWDYTHQYINELSYNKWFKKVISLVLNYIRLWDRQAADRVDVFIANSKTTQRRIAKYYRRESTVIYPPVATGRYSIGTVADYFLVGGRLAPYKRIDIVIQAFRQLGLPLVIFGDGVDMPRLKRLAAGAGNIRFAGAVDDASLAELYRGCRAFLNPQEEDFGITVIEAMASGRPVIAYARGGATETILPGVTGEFFTKQTPDALAAAVSAFDQSRYDPARIREHALTYSTEAFREKISAFVAEEVRKFRK